MEDFKIFSLTVSERQLIIDQEYKKRNEFLYGIGYHKAGCYEMTFPNGKKYIGKSSQLGKQLQKYFEILVPIKPKIKKEQYKRGWYEKAIEENKGRLKTFADLRIRIWYDRDYVLLEKELLESVPEDCRSNYYNTNFMS